MVRGRKISRYNKENSCATPSLVPRHPPPPPTLFGCTTVKWSNQIKQGPGNEAMQCPPHVSCDMIFEPYREPRDHKQKVELLPGPSFFRSLGHGFPNCLMPRLTALFPSSIGHGHLDMRLGKLSHAQTICPFPPGIGDGNIGMRLHTHIYIYRQRSHSYYTPKSFSDGVAYVLC